MSPATDMGDLFNVPDSPVRPSADLAGIRSGTHLCAFYSDAAELTSVASTFVAAGLSGGDKVLYVAGERSPDDVVGSLTERGVPTERAISSGQLLIKTFAEAYGAIGELDLDVVADGFRSTARQARTDGFPGLRVAGEMGDFVRAIGSPERMLSWERLATRVQHEEGITSVCQYDTRLLDDSMLRLLAGEHSGRSPKSLPAPLAGFYAQKAPWGLRVVGELDCSNRGQFGRALRARLDTEPRLVLDLGQLAFIDVGCLDELFDAAVSLTDDSRIVVLNATPQFRRIVDIAGFSHDRVEILP